MNDPFYSFSWEYSSLLNLKAKKKISFWNIYSLSQTHPPLGSSSSNSCFQILVLQEKSSEPFYHFPANFWLGFKNLLFFSFLFVFMWIASGLLDPFVKFRNNFQMTNTWLIDRRSECSEEAPLIQPQRACSFDHLDYSSSGLFFNEHPLFFLICFPLTLPHPVLPEESLARVLSCSRDERGAARWQESCNLLHCFPRRLGWPLPVRCRSCRFSGSLNFFIWKIVSQVVLILALFQRLSVFPWAP